MEIRVEKGQFRWKLLNFVFWGLVLIMLPLVFFIMPFLAFVGATLLIHIFIKSSLDAPEHEE